MSNKYQNFYPIVCTVRGMCTDAVGIYQILLWGIYTEKKEKRNRIAQEERKSVGEGKSGGGREEMGGGRYVKKRKVAKER